VNPVFWDHHPSQVISGVVAVNTVLAACALPEPEGLYMVRFFVSGGSCAAERLVEFTIGTNTPAIGSEIYQSQFVAYSEPIAPATHCHPPNSECVLIHGPCPRGSEARIYLRTAMIASDKIAVAVWARYLGGVRAAGPLRSSMFPT